MTGLGKTHRSQNATIEARIACWRAWLVVASSGHGVAWREEFELDGVADGWVDGVGQETQSLADCDDLLCCERQRDETEREREFGGHYCDIDSRGER